VFYTDLQRQGEGRSSLSKGKKKGKEGMRRPRRTFPGQNKEKKKVEDISSFPSSDLKKKKSPDNPNSLGKRGGKK